MKKAIRYSVFVCLFSWAMFAVAHWGFGIGADTPTGLMVFSTVYMFFPLITALVLQAIDKEKFNHTGLVNFKVRWAWVVAWLLPVVMTLACILVNGLMPGVELQYNSEQLINQYHVPEEQQEMVREQLSSLPAWLMVVSTIFSGLLAGITVNAIAAFGEEYGWRNYLVGALREVKFWKAAIFIGFVWGIWHFPLILLGHNYPNEPRWGVILMVVMCILLGIIELYFVLKSKSIVVAAILHGTINAVGGMTIYFTLGGNDFVNGMPGLSGFIVMAVTILCIWAYDKFISKDNFFGMTLGESLDRSLDRFVPSDDAKRVPGFESEKGRD
ncbi:MAG: CPBP family intramembrane metalloprotease [Bacteroidales bacterium]|nr:CPBP family intramembrane metalloprotease [Bacteroidales bacterium]